MPWIEEEKCFELTTRQGDPSRKSTKTRYVCCPKHINDNASHESRYRLEKPWMSLDKRWQRRTRFSTQTKRKITPRRSTQTNHVITPQKDRWKPCNFKLKTRFLSCSTRSQPKMATFRTMCNSSARLLRQRDGREDRDALDIKATNRAVNFKPPRDGSNRGDFAYESSCPNKTPKMKGITFIALVE